MDNNCKDFLNRIEIIEEEDEDDYDVNCNFCFIEYTLESDDF